MNIIWKGVNSDTKTGLIICELPPITKPNMIVQETHIDGRDGSIIEELGYESYDKVVRVGLRGNFDINDIVKYFTGSGNLILSNEDDKYYKAQIIKKIDYDRLLRFRTADISFRVQPFKYLYREQTQEFDNPTSIIVINRGLENSKPKMTITGSGTISLSVNGVTAFSYTFPNGDTSVVIDSEKEDAYVGTTLKNRSMTGEFPILLSGKNTIAITGTVTKIEVNANSRWL